LTIGRRDLAQFDLNKQAGNKDSRREPMNAKAKYEAYRRAVPAWWPRRHPWGNRASPANPPVTNRDGCHG
jgi:hypothetical protein